MRLLNVGCGATRVQSSLWVNLDNLRTQLHEGTPERAALDAEPNYVEHDIFSGPLPFDEKTFDGVTLFHCLEHFDAQDGVRLLQNCLHVLKPGAAVMVSVPDASYFRRVDAEDRNENWPRLFGQKDPANPIPTFRQAALFFEQHRVILTEDAVWCCLRQAGFAASDIHRIDAERTAFHGFAGNIDALEVMASTLNRRKFSLVMLATK